MYKEPNIETRHFGGKSLPLSSVLFALAGQENANNDEGNAMQMAAEFIKMVCDDAQKGI